MTATEAAALGYTLEAVSPFEVGLVKNGKGIRSWWASDFYGDFPSIDNPKIQEAIAITESMTPTP